MSWYFYIYQKLQEEDKCQYFAMDLDSNGCLRSVFWADRRVYSMFKCSLIDLLIKLKNSGCCLLRLLALIITGTLFYLVVANQRMRPWTHLFGYLNNSPFHVYGALIAIITNQDAAMSNALRQVFPESRQPFCKWHIINMTKTSTMLPGQI